MSTGALESAQNFVAGLLDLRRTRFELFGTELREELARLATTWSSAGWRFLCWWRSASGSPPWRSSFTPTRRTGSPRRSAWRCSPLFVAAGIVAWRLRHLAEAKPRAFDATISELQRRPQHDPAMNLNQGLAQRRQELVERVHRAQRAGSTASRRCRRADRAQGGRSRPRSPTSAAIPRSLRLCAPSRLSARARSSISARARSRRTCSFGARDYFGSGSNS